MSESSNFPKIIKEGIWAFPPNKSCNGAVSWWIECEPEPILIDCPFLNEQNIQWLKEHSFGRLSRIILTNRESHGNIREFCSELGWPLLIQEQEAYLLPALQSLESFQDECKTTSGISLIWTPGPTPGSCVAYAPPPFNVLFCGRLLIPVAVNELAPLRTRKTFHWPTQQKSLEKLQNWISSKPLPELASGVAMAASGCDRLIKWEECNWLL